MAREISIHQISLEVLRGELRCVVNFLRDLRQENCELVFGWHWGMDYPPAAPWHRFLISLEAVEAEIRKPEDAGFGQFGGDDVTIAIPQLDCQFLFCHHSGIHLTFTPTSHIAEEFAARWSSAGFAVTETDGLPQG